MNVVKYYSYFLCHNIFNAIIKLYVRSSYLTLDRFRKSVKKELGMYKDREQGESESEKKKTN